MQQLHNALIPFADVLLGLARFVDKLYGHVDVLGNACQRVDLVNVHHVAFLKQALACANGQHEAKLLTLGASANRLKRTIVLLKLGQRVNGGVVCDEATIKEVIVTPEVDWRSS